MTCNRCSGIIKEGVCSACGMHHCIICSIQLTTSTYWTKGLPYCAKHYYQKERDKMKTPKMICGHCMKTIHILPKTSDSLFLKCNCGTFDFKHVVYGSEIFSDKIKSLGWKVIK